MSLELSELREWALAKHGHGLLRCWAAVQTPDFSPAAPASLSWLPDGLPGKLEEPTSSEEGFQTGTALKSS